MVHAIEVDSLGKQYLVDHQEQRTPYRTLREGLTNLAVSPWHWWRQDRSGPVRKDFWALRDVTFEVAEGEVVGIIGRNGAGKSTLLKILSRVTKPTTGTATLHGEVRSLLEVGTGFHPELTGRENIFLSGAILGMPKSHIRRRFDEIVAFAEVENFVDMPVKRYSSGMYVRLAFAVAAHLEPAILLVDEVLAVGDARFQQKCLGSMEVTARSGRTILFVSHNMASIRQLCQRAILLTDGQVAADGPSDEVIHKYLATGTRGGMVALRDWHDRRTNGAVRIVNLLITDAAGRVTDQILFGSDVRITLVVEFDQPVRDPTFGILVHTAKGEPVLDLRSTHSGFLSGHIVGDVIVQACVHNIHLYPGDYSLSPWISDSGVQEDLDWVKYCCTLRVQPAPGPSGDLRLRSEFGRYWIPSDWNVRRLDKAVENGTVASSSAFEFKR
jgi:lipopolysaccharide transport system ATP-binding protein